MSKTAVSLSPGHRRYALLILAVVYMFNFIDRQILAILLPAIREEFSLSDVWLGFLTGPAFAMFYILLGIPVARYADRHNRRNLIAVAVGLWSATTALSGLVTNFFQLALARIGVGVGEAGCSPPAHSLIADMYSPGQRATAMGLYTVGISAGIMLAYIFGGWLVENVGWREAFLAVGVPGIVLAFIVRFTLPEPARGLAENRTAVSQRPSMPDVLRFLLARRSFIHMTIAAGLSSLVGYSVIFFLPSFIDRSFGVPFDQVGIWLGLILGVSGGAGFFLGGRIADHLGQRGHQRALRFIGLTVLASGVLLALMFLSSSWTMVLLLFVLPAATMNVYLAPVLAQVQSLVALRMRAVASALALLVINAIGLMIGPQVTGILSTMLQAQFGEEAMRYSLFVITVVILPWAAIHYFCAGKFIDADLARAAEDD